MNLAKNIAKIFLFLTPLTPLLLAESMFFPFITPKMLALEALVLGAFLLWLYLWSKDPKTYNPKFSFLTLAVGAYTLISFIAALTGVNFWRSFWSTFERMEGVFTWIVLFLFLVLLQALLQKREDWVWLLRISVAASVFIELKAMLPLLISEGALPTYISATFGNPLFLGVYGIVHLTMALLLIHWLRATGAKNPHKVTSQVDGRMNAHQLKNPWFLFYLLAVVTNALSIFLTTNQGPMLGLVSGGIVALFIGLLASKKKTSLALLKVLGIGMVILAATFPLWKDNPIAKRIGIDPTASKDRILNWQTALNAFAAKPLLGWGSNNYLVAQNEFYNPEVLAITREGFDRVHNKYLEVALDSGALGLISYMAIFGVAAVAIVKRRKEEPFQAAVLSGFLAAYLFQNITVFDNPGSYMPLFLVLGFIQYAYSKELPSKIELDPKPWILVTALLLGLGLLWQGVGQPYLANKALANALFTQQGNPGNQEEIFKNYQKALSYETLGNYEARLRLAAFVSSQQAPSGQLLEFAIDELEKEVRISRNDTLIHIVLGKLYERKTLLTGNEEARTKAREYLERAIELAPTRPESIEHYVVFLINQGQGEEAREQLQRIKKLNEDVFNDHKNQWFLVMSYYGEGNMQAAYDKLLEIEKRGLIFNSESQLITQAQIATEVGKHQDAVRWYAMLVDQQKNNAQYRMELAKAHKNAGQFQLARNEANNALAIDPSLKEQVDEFTRSLN